MDIFIIYPACVLENIHTSLPSEIDKESAVLALGGGGGGRGRGVERKFGKKINIALLNPVNTRTWE
jgi:hypothetical protein